MLNGLVGEVIMSATGRAAAHKNLEDGLAEEIVNEAFGRLFRLPTEEDYVSEESESRELEENSETPSSEVI